MIWFIGVMVLTLRLAASWTRARALAGRGSTAADDSWQRVASRLSTALDLERAVRLVVSAGIDVPSVVGWLKPVIILPVSSLSGLTAEQLEMVLAHELAHIRRHDFLVNVLQTVVETLLFYHPAVWWLSRVIRAERENCCDDLVVKVCGDPLSYARALAQLEELRALPPALAVAANGGSLIERVRRLVGARSDRSLFSSGWTAAAAMASFVALIALTTAPMLAERQPAPTPQVAGSQVDVSAQKAPKPEQQTPKPDEDMNDDAMSSDEADFEVDPVVPPTPPVPPPAPEAPMVTEVPPIPSTPMLAPYAVIRPRIRIAPMAFAMAPPAIAEGIAEGLAESMVGESDDQESSSPTPPGKLSISELIALRVQGVTPEYIQSIRSAGFDKLSIRDIISLRAQGVTPEYIDKIRKTGLGDLTAREIVSMRVQGVTPEYVAEMRAAGVQIKTARDVALAQAHLPDFVRHSLPPDTTA